MLLPPTLLLLFLSLYTTYVHASAAPDPHSISSPLHEREVTMDWNYGESTEANPDKWETNTPSASSSTTHETRGVGPPPVSHPDYRKPSPVSIATTASAVVAAQAAASALRAKIDIDNNLGISQGMPNTSWVDPCGPPSSNIPGKPGSFDTCHRNVSTEHAYSGGDALGGKTAYGVSCQDDGTGYVLDQGTCGDALETICLQISGVWGDRYQANDKWIWSTQTGNCTFGYWLPKGGAPAPSFDRCRNQILGIVNGVCVGPKWNVGSVNLEVLPLLENGNGRAVDAVYPSYLMVAQGSFWGVNSMDGGFS